MEKCLLGTCQHSSIKKIFLRPHEKSDDISMMIVKLFDDVPIQEVDESGQAKTQKDLVVFQVSLSTFTSLLQSKLGNFI